jgi:phosphoglycolate phosphatase
MVFQGRTHGVLSICKWKEARPMVRTKNFADIRGILFDKDGTLVDFHGTWLPAYRSLATSFANGDPSLAGRLLRLGGADPDSDEIDANSVFAVGPISDVAAIWHTLLEDWELEELNTAVIDGLAAGTLHHCRAFDGMAALLKRLSARGFRLGVATNDGENGSRAMLERLDLIDSLDFVAGWDSGFAAKPAPDMVDGFCQATRLAPEAVVVVGDSVADMEMAKQAQAGVSVGVLSGTGGRKDLVKIADVIIESVAELEALLGGDGQ